MLPQSSLILLHKKGLGKTEMTRTVKPLQVIQIFRNNNPDLPFSKLYTVWWPVLQRQSLARKTTKPFLHSVQVCHVDAKGS